MRNTISNITSVIVIGGALVLGTLGYNNMASHLHDLTNGHYETFANGQVVHVNSRGLSDAVELIGPAAPPTEPASEPSQG